MNPINFKESNHTYAENDPNNNPLPVLEGNGVVVSCWRVSIWEALRILWTGKIWHSQHTFGRPPQPIFKTTKKKELILKSK